MPDCQSDLPFPTIHPLKIKVHSLIHSAVTDKTSGKKKTCHIKHGGKKGLKSDPITIPKRVICRHSNNDTYHTHDE